MQTDGVIDVLDRLFAGFALAVAALKSRTRDQIPVGVGLDDDGQSELLHAVIIS